MKAREQAIAVLALCLGTAGGVLTWVLLFLVARKLNPRDPVGSLVVLSGVIVVATAVPTWMLAGRLSIHASKRLALGHVLAGLVASAWFVAVSWIAPAADASRVAALCLAYLLIAPAVVLCVARLRCGLFAHRAESPGNG